MRHLQFVAALLVASTLSAGCDSAPGADPLAAADEQSSPEPARTIAITIDDLPGVSRSGRPDDFRQMNADMLAALNRADATAVGFVNERALNRAGDRDAGLAILGSWLDAGMGLGNHTYDHRGLTNTPPDEFEEAILRGERETRPLVEARGQRLEFFRHPMTQTGPTAGIKTRIDEFLASHGYRTAPFTIEDADYMFALIYDDAVRRDDRALADRTAAAYLEHQSAMFDWFELLSRETFDREIPQILLIHVNRLHARLLGDELAAMQARGYRVVSLAAAMADPAYATPDGFIGNYGPSWLHRWREGLGLPGRMRDEPDPPQWVMDAYARLQ